MDQTPTRPKWNERFPSPPSGWARTPYRGAGHRGASPQGYYAYTPNSPTYSPGFNRGHWRDSPGSGGGRGFGGSPMSGSGGRNFSGKQRRGNNFGRPTHFNSSAVNVQHDFPGPIETYFSPSMLEDPWAALQPKHTETPTSNDP
ncbi:lymphocyte antigen 6 family member pge isoform X1 [Syngnathus acus]|uniref:lymphocyte antigen 6 family member pge isoform X1 n=1 Tax=Syngnathus acus TaxID=161584 RepID=UPI0018861C36|nr:lymphocyte antigen 6 family member pge isoform X1 [Syngnathus acus]